ncbi:MAG: hypothetical protein QW416_08625 [Candidatus Nitrosocaldaceae archaeon]
MIAKKTPDFAYNGIDAAIKVGRNFIPDTDDYTRNAILKQL